MIEKNGQIRNTYYFRDATGNVMAVYEQEGNGAMVELKEQHIYGSQRLGMVTPAEGYSDMGTHYTGLRTYELSDHLGNVTAVVSDMPSVGVVSATNYYPFGMAMRSIVSSDGYRYGFNGQEKETELNPSITSAEYWMYDGRLGRRWNLDPVVKSWQSNYSCLSNSPIWRIDPKGDDDFFDSEGNFIESRGDGDAIIIVNQGKTIEDAIADPKNSAMNITEIEFSPDQSSKTFFTNLLSHYSQIELEETFNVVGFIKNSNNDNERDAALAYVSKSENVEEGFAVGLSMPEGKVSKRTFRSYMNLINTLVHENWHRNNPSVKSSLGHIGAYNAQFNHYSFALTAEDKGYQYEQVSNVVELANLSLEENKTLKEINSVIKTTNKALKKSGSDFRISYNKEEKKYESIDKNPSY